MRCDSYCNDPGSHGVLIVVGYTAAALAGLGCYFAEPEVGWRLCLGLQIVAPSLLLAGSFRLPESPRWLLSQGRDQQTLDVLRRLHDQADDDTASHGANGEFYQILVQLELEMNNKILGTRDMLKRPSYRRRILAGLLVECVSRQLYSYEFSLLTHLWRRFASQSSGVLVINNYQILLYNNLGLYGWLPLLLYTIFSAWGALSNWVNSLILDRLGRVPVLTYGLVGCISVMAVETALVASYASTSNKGGNAAAVVFLFLFIMFYGGTQDASGYVYCSEIFPTPVRAQGLGICIAGLFATALVYTQVYPTASANIGWKYYLVFILVPAACVPFVRRLPETNGLSLEEIAARFGDAVAVDIRHLTLERSDAVSQRLQAVGLGTRSEERSRQAETKEDLVVSHHDAQPG
ncbi:hypothetical protein LTS17_001244 [Exophiala oligosperma]